MPGQLTAYAYTARVPVVCYYQGAPTDVPQPDEVAGWLEMIGFNLGTFGVLSQLRRVEVWAPDRPDAPPDFRLINPKAGLYRPWDQTVQLHAHFATPGLLAHEVGHHVTLARIEQLAEAFRAAYGPGDVPPVPGAAELFGAVCR